MKYFKFTISCVLAALAFYALNTKFGSIPPLGKFLSPVTGIWQNDKSENDIREVQIKGLTDRVSIYYDEYLIPHIFAKNDRDLYKAQGYITAKHRLWQMEFQTHTSAGRLSEIFGETALNFDRSQRRKGLGFGAENSLKSLKEDPEMLELLEAYVDGVNSYIEQLKPKNFPVEYKLLDYSPEPWTLKKTTLLGMHMSDMLAGRNNDLEYTNALRKFGKGRLDMIFPDFYDAIDPVIPEERDWSDWEVYLPEQPKNYLSMDSISKVLSKPHPDNGSNNWAVAPSKSYSNNPILANDPHLGLNLPSIWFAMQLATPENNTFGVTLPGTIGIIIGFNNSVSWGATNATRDVKDWYKIKFKDGTKNEYFHNSRWKKTALRIENIKIKGQKPHIDSVFYTHHGPITYDNSFKGDNPHSGYAMQWTGHMGGNILRTFIELNKANNYADYKEALSHYTAPAQNFIFSSTEGDIALWIQGKFPNKWKEQGKYLLDGSNARDDWQGFVPQEHNAHILNPEQGFLSSANQHPVDKSYPYYVFSDGYQTYRNRVINNFLKSKEKFNIEDFKGLHNNNYNLRASEVLPAMIEATGNMKLTEKQIQILDQLKAWDYYNDIEKLGPTLWELWWNKVYELTWDEFKIKGEILPHPSDYQTIYLLNNDPENEFIDISNTEHVETSDDLFRLSFKEFSKKISEWNLDDKNHNWGQHKATYVGHILQALPAFSRFNLPIGGGRHIVNATSKNHGPSWRMIVEMSSPPKAIAIYPGGQSGNPGSKHYDDFIDRWASGKYLDMIFMQSNNENQAIIGTQILTP